jgi:broad specificity phosphatase PhoE
VTSFFFTHPEVVVDPTTPVEQWILSKDGRRRSRSMSRLCAGRVQLVVTSAETKAREAGAILANSLDLPVEIDQSLGELNRDSTGYLEPPDFELVVDEFFARPDESVRGWERARDAQRRVVAAVRDRSTGTSYGIAFVAHGGVGALLMAHFSRVPINRSLDQPGLGSYFSFSASSWTLRRGWRRIPDSNL